MTSRLIVCAAALATALAACAPADTGPATAGHVAVTVAPITLSGVTDACYTLSVSNGVPETVWTRTNVCANAYGDGAGSVSYVGTCDAAAGAALNTISLTLDALYDQNGEIATGSYQNPTASGALTQKITCLEGRDVAVDFDLTVMRMATQGFFDVAVTFEDIFCSAKFDCEDPAGDPILLLADDTGTRSPTAILALACTGGPGADTVLHMSNLVVSCPSRADLVIDPTGGPGNLSAAPSPVVPNATLFEAAVYRGVEQLGSYNKRYWNVALGLDDVTGCTLAATATASDGDFTDGWTPPGTTWPYIVFAAELDTCGRHQLNGGDGVVSTDYTGLAGIAFAAQFGAGGVTYDASWWDPAWRFQRVLDVAAGATPLTADSTFTFTFDHAALVAAGQSLASGDDVRLLRWNGAGFDELDRVALTGWDSGAVTLAFSPAAAIGANVTDSDYVLAYGNAAAGAPPADGRQVYWLWEDFDDGDFTTGNVWTANHGTWDVTGGYARLVNPSGSDSFEAGLYYPGGAAWTDYEVSMRIRDASTGGSSYPGPALRVANPATNATSLWWFEYYRATTQATMRPFVNNTDYSWSYNVALPAAFPSNAWVTTEYRVVGDRFWSWYEGSVLHDGVTAAVAHRIGAGSIALGAHNGYPTPQEFHYDDVRVWKHLPNPPTITLGAITAH
ncbi:MAG: hypothetical protein CVT68_09170 [Actinobacteria bacterium HGW-Actinobacteria-8]|jgi:ribosomal protein S27E|nr:MAG: hypothetical protein CVT68_09170 [Actinobacteria bacterium HGW-Actinobacteria-8]